MSKSITGCIGHSYGDYTPSSIEAFNDKVALRCINVGSIRTEGGIIVPEKAEINNRLGLYEVLSAGKKAEDMYGIKTGDYVYADRLAVFYDTSPICLMKFEVLSDYQKQLINKISSNILKYIIDSKINIPWEIGPYIDSISKTSIGG